MTMLASLRSQAPIVSLMLGALGLGAIAGATLAPRESAAACPAGTATVARGELFLGRSMPGGKVIEEAAFNAFASGEIARALPDGYTILESSGGWRNPTSGKLETERSNVLVAIGEADQLRERLTAIADAYRSQFSQQSVLLVVSNSCARF